MPTPIDTRVRSQSVATKAVPRTARVRLRGAAAVLAALVLFATDAHGFSFDDVTKRAEKLAASAYQKPGAALPKGLKALNYDDYRDIRARSERALWRDMKLPFEIMLYHRGYLYEDAVATQNHAEGERDIQFDPDAFDYGKPRSTQELRASARSFASTFTSIPDHKDEVLTFSAQATSGGADGEAFRAVGAAWRSIPRRATGEEFPRFVELWIERTQRARQELHRLRSARFAPRGRRVPVRPQAGCHHRARRGRQAVSPAERREAGWRRSRACSFRREPASTAGGLSSAGSRFRRGVHPDGGEQWLWRRSSTPSACSSPLCGSRTREA